MSGNQNLTWDGCDNVRDLGGLSTCDGRMTLWRAIVRSDTPAKLTEAGWSALYAYGIRTIISVRTYGMAEDELNITPRYPDLVTVQVAIEDITDPEFCNSGLPPTLGVHRSITRMRFDAGRSGTLPLFLL